MEDLADQLRKADRLNRITQRVGFALWQLQELEGVSAQYYVLVAQAKLGMGLDAGNALVDDEQSKTFGRTISKNQIESAKTMADLRAQAFLTSSHLT